jgi:hypothetical protein
MGVGAPRFANHCLEINSEKEEQNESTYLVDDIMKKGAHDE